MKNKIDVIDGRNIINMYLTGNLNAPLEESVKKLTNKQVKDFFKSSQEIIEEEINKEILKNLIIKTIMIL